MSSVYSSLSTLAAHSVDLYAAQRSCQERGEGLLVTIFYLDLYARAAASIRTSTRQG